MTHIRELSRILCAKRKFQGFTIVKLDSEERSFITGEKEINEELVRGTNFTTNLYITAIL